MERVLLACGGCTLPGPLLLSSTCTVLKASLLVMHSVAAARLVAAPII